MIFESGISSNSTVSNKTGQDLSQINLKKLNKREISEILICLSGKNAKINRLAPPRKTQETQRKEDELSEHSKKIKKQPNDSQSFHTHTYKSRQSKTSKISSQFSIAMRESGYVPKNSPLLDNKEEVLFLAIKGINFMREIYLHFGVDLGEIDETIKVEPHHFLIKMLQIHKPFLNPEQYGADIEGFLKEPQNNLNPSSYFGIDYQFKQIEKLQGKNDSIIKQNIETCLTNSKKFFEGCLSLINQKTSRRS